MKKTLLIFIVMWSVVPLVVGQTAFLGLTPGKSTRADAERVLGLPVKIVSATLAEYGGRENVQRIYAQYEGEGRSSVILRIELLCYGPADDPEHQWDGCFQYARNAAEPWDANIVLKPDAESKFKQAVYHGAPSFLSVISFHKRMEDSYWQRRVALYSNQLYEVVVPKSCNGTFAGVWETNRGRLTITRSPSSSEAKKFDIRGAYSIGDGTISGIGFGWEIEGQWKDSTGSGTMTLTLVRVPIVEGQHVVPQRTWTPTFKGTWTRTSGRGPKEGKWDGRCVEDPD